MEPAHTYDFTFEQKKHVSAQEQTILSKAFRHYDENGDGTMPESEFKKVMADMGQKLTDDQVKEMFSKVDRNKDGVVSWEEFKIMMIAMKDTEADKFGKILESGKAVMENEHHAIHSYSIEERHTFASVINVLIKDEESLADRLPMNPEDDSLFHVFDNGVLVNKLMLKLDENCIDARAINTKTNMNVYEVNQNLKMGLAAAKATGIKLIGVSP